MNVSFLIFDDFAFIENINFKNLYGGFRYPSGQQNANDYDYYVSPSQTTNRSQYRGKRTTDYGRQNGDGGLRLKSDNILTL